MKVRGELKTGGHSDSRFSAKDNCRRIDERRTIISSLSSHTPTRLADGLGQGSVLFFTR